MDCFVLFFFFFQAEDGIRDDLVTGVQTCALPISETADAELGILSGKWERWKDGKQQERPFHLAHAPSFQSPLHGTPNGKRDRKSTRLNSSHQIISYAVFCLKKKKTKKNAINTIQT